MPGKISPYLVLLIFYKVVYNVHASSDHLLLPLKESKMRLSSPSSSWFVIDKAPFYLLLPKRSLVSRTAIYISVGQIPFNVHTTVKCPKLKRPSSFLPRYPLTHQTPTTPPHPLPRAFSLDFKRCICSPWVERITMTIKNQKRQRPCNDWTSRFELN